MLEFQRRFAKDTNVLFVVRFTDKPQCLDVRQKFLPAHLQWLEERSDSVLVAGSVRVELDSAPIGACWIVEAESKSAVEALFQSDPFWANGLRESYEILHWSKAFPDHRIPV